jgi:hypothetical protein
VLQNEDAKRGPRDADIVRCVGWGTCAVHSKLETIFFFTVSQFLSQTACTVPTVFYHKLPVRLLLLWQTVKRIQILSCLIGPGTGTGARSDQNSLRGKNKVHSFFT